MNLSIDMIDIDHVNLFMLQNCSFTGETLFELVDKYPSKNWDWNELSETTPPFKLLLKYSDKPWNWPLLTQRPYGHELLKQFPEKFTTDNIIHVHLSVINMRLIEQYPDAKWKISRFSKNTYEWNGCGHGSRITADWYATVNRQGGTYEFNDHHLMLHLQMIKQENTRKRKEVELQEELQRQIQELEQERKALQQKQILLNPTQLHESIDETEQEQPIRIKLIEDDYLKPQQLCIYLKLILIICVGFSCLKIQPFLQVILNKVMLSFVYI